MAELVVASNRGPVQFEINDEGTLTCGRGAGGMVAALGPALAGQGGTWAAAAITEGDRVAARQVARSGRVRQVELPQGPIRLRSLVIDPRQYQNYYNRVSNRTLWFLQHYLFDVPRHPRFDQGFRGAWRDYRAVNQAFAAACAGPGYFTMLPSTIAYEFVEGMLGADLLGFLVPRWVRNFLRCCEELGFEVNRRQQTVRTPDGRDAWVRAYPLGVDGDDLRARAAEPDVQAQRRSLRDLARGRSLIVRVDRMELSKNILRGLDGYTMLLEQNPRR